MGMTPEQAEVRALRDQGLGPTEIAAQLGTTVNAVKKRLYRAKKWKRAELVESHGYNLSAEEKTPEEAWAEHVQTFERAISGGIKKQWQVIERPGPFCVYHSTDEHIDDDKAALNIIAADVAAAHDMDAVMCHGGDALNNWPIAGRLAQQWAHQQCTLPDALLRLQHFISIFKPDVWTNGNHEEMNPYLENLIETWLPDGVIRDYWAVKFIVRTPRRDARCVLSHKFSKGGSWFHKLHGHIREILEGEEADLLMDGHLHSDGVLDHTLPERDVATLCVASAGYKLADKYAARISRGGKVPKMRGRAHWIICDDQAPADASMFTAFKCPKQAEAYLGGLQNLRET